MANNPYVNKVQKADGTTIIDISDSTAIASDVAQGKYFYLATGEKAQGTATGGGGSESLNDVVVLDNGGGIQIDGLTVTIKPIQSLNGYDYPWPGGAGKNIFDEQYPSISGSMRYRPIAVPNGTYTMSTELPLNAGTANLFFFAGSVSSGASTGTNGVSKGIPRTVTTSNGYITVAYRIVSADTQYSPENFETQIESGSTATAYVPYENVCPISGYTQATAYVNNTESATGATTYTVPFGSAGTVYQGDLDMISGVLTITHKIVDFAEQSWSYSSSSGRWEGTAPDESKRITSRYGGIIAEKYKTDTDAAAGSNGVLFYAYQTFYVYDTVGTASPTGKCTCPVNSETYNLTAQQVALLSGKNYIWSDTGDVEISISGIEPTFATYYTGTTDPTSSLGSDGDIYLKVVS